MRIGIVSDTHGLLRREVIEGLQGVDHIIQEKAPGIVNMNSEYLVL